MQMPVSSVDAGVDEAKNSATRCAGTSKASPQRNARRDSSARSCGSREAVEQAEQVSDMQKEIPEGIELLHKRWEQTPTGKPVSALRKLYQRGRRILRAVRSELKSGNGSAADLNPDYYPAVGDAETSTASAIADEKRVGTRSGSESTSLARRTAGDGVTRRSTGGRRGERKRLDGTRREVVEVKATGKGSGLVTKRRGDYSHLTLSAIKAAKDELWAKGCMPDGMVLREDEVRYILETYFDYKRGDPLPDRLEIMGLPVKVSE
jgi:hypothetical protein